LTGASHVLLLQLSASLPSSFALIKPANPGSPGKMAVKTERESYFCKSGTALSIIHHQHHHHIFQYFRLSERPQNPIKLAYIKQQEENCKTKKNTNTSLHNTCSVELQLDIVQSVNYCRHLQTPEQVWQSSVY